MANLMIRTTHFSKNAVLFNFPQFGIYRDRAPAIGLQAVCFLGHAPIFQRTYSASDGFMAVCNVEGTDYTI